MLEGGMVKGGQIKLPNIESVSSLFWTEVMQCEKAIRLSRFLNEVSWVLEWLLFCLSLQTILLITGSLNESFSPKIPHFLD